MMESKKKKKKKKTRPWKHNRSSARKAKEAENEALHHRFMDLQQEWDSIKCSKTNLKTFPSSPTTNPSSVFASLQLLANSPGTLMSYLQQKRSPSSDKAWKVRNNDLAIEEIMRDRRAAIESGKLKGRRLFESLESATDIGLDGLVLESEVRFAISYEFDDDNDEKEENKRQESLTHILGRSSSCSSLSSSYDCSGELEKGEELMMKEENTMTSIEDGRGLDDRAGRQRRRYVFIDWLLIGLVVYAAGIISMKISNGCKDLKEVCLVPT